MALLRQLPTVSIYMTPSIFKQPHSLLDPKIGVYAVIVLDKDQLEDEDDDCVSMMLASSMSPPISGDDDDCWVEYQDGVVKWVGMDGKEYQLGETDNPFDPDAGEALRAEGGLITIFIDQKSGEHRFLKTFHSF